jgi:RNA polymerase sigma-70 factor (ECF subfamily)
MRPSTRKIWHRDRQREDIVAQTARGVKAGAPSSAATAGRPANDNSGQTLLTEEDLLTERIENFIIRSGRNFGAGGADLEDLRQDIIIIMIARARRDALRERGHKKFITTCARRLCRQARRRAIRMVPLEEMDSGDDGHGFIDHRSGGLDPEQRLAAAERQARVRAAIDILTPVQNLVIVCRYFLDMDTDEIAALLGMACGTVRVRLHRAGRVLAKILHDLAFDS